MEELLSRPLNAELRTAPGRIARRVLLAIYHGLERSRQRRALAALSDASLRDIGLTRRDIACEITQPFWRR